MSGPRFLSSGAPTFAADYVERNAETDPDVARQLEAPLLHQGRMYLPATSMQVILLGRNDVFERAAVLLDVNESVGTACALSAEDLRSIAASLISSAEDLEANARQQSAAALDRARKGPGQ